jgi:phosphatidylethanolamine/phosphatidyl-N-methylethanolamine N-methyltransferase
MNSQRAAQSTVEAVYKRLAPFYDVIYGALLHHGRQSAIGRLSPRPGESILEIGVGTGLSALHYPSECRVVAIDVSAPMLERAQARLERKQCHHVRLARMDAGHLAFGNGVFDAVYAPYVLNVVPDPVAVVREMRRVCRPDGRMVLLNHFDHAASPGQAVNRLAGRLAVLISGADWHLNLDGLLSATKLVAVSVDAVNLPPVSSVVVCRRS